MVLGLILALRNWGQSTPASRFFWLFVPALWFLWGARQRG